MMLKGRPMRYPMTPLEALLVRHLANGRPCIIVPETMRARDFFALVDPPGTLSASVVYGKLTDYRETAEKEAISMGMKIPEDLVKPPVADLTIKTDGPFITTQKTVTIDKADWEAAIEMQAEVVRSLMCGGMAVLCVVQLEGLSKNHPGMGIFVLGQADTDKGREDVAGFLRAAASTLVEVPDIAAAGENQNTDGTSVPSTASPE